MSNTKPPLAFISYDFKVSEDERVRFVNEVISSGHAFTVEDWSMERRAPREDWDKAVHGKIGRSDFVIVLVDEGMDTAPVAAELAEARRCNVPFFGVYVGKAKAGAGLPEGLGANRTIAWDWGRIAAAIGQVTREGKHHVFR
jgi:hypothetical protein